MISGVLLDLAGVIYEGEMALPGALNAVDRLRRAGFSLRFVTNTTLIGMMGEPRHRRSQVYDLTTGTRRRLFHNNTIRTVSPEYSWQPSADGTSVLIESRTPVTKITRSGTAVATAIHL